MVTGKLVEKVADGLFTSIICHQNRYYAINDTNVEVYQHSDNWKLLHSFPVNVENQSIITLSISEYRLNVCVSGDKRIDTYYLDGQLNSSQSVWETDRIYKH